jgi:hypothetical protein
MVLQLQSFYNTDNKLTTKGEKSMNQIKKFKSWNGRTIKAGLMAVMAVIVIVSGLAITQPAEAHCDSYNGPVVQAAQKALDTGNIKLIQPYVQKDAEAELLAAFNHTLAVRKLGGEAKTLADQFFFETAVRLHREGEGAPYTGLTDEPVPASILAADKAMKTGNLDAVTLLLNEAVEHGIAEKYEAVVAARAEAKKLGTMEALREQAEAELIFERYVYGLYTAASGAEVHQEGGEPGH